MKFLDKLKSIFGKNNTKLIEAANGLIEINHKNNKEYLDGSKNTRLIISKDSVKEVNGKSVYTCQVSHFDGRMDKSKNEFKEVLVTLNLDKLQDEEYKRSVMEDLLPKDRVDKYLSEGMQDNPQIKRGNYLGQINEENGKKSFDTKIGQIVHDSVEMNNKRNIQRQNKNNNKNNEVLGSANVAINQNVTEVNFTHNMGVGGLHNTTRLIVDKSKDICIDGEILSNAKVSWYNDHDVEFIDSNRNAQTPKNTFTDIVTMIDIEKLQNDAEYRSVVMLDLLDENRVEGYINEGLKEDPSRKCGNYIGHVNNQGLNKVFDPRFGEVIHNSDKMIQNRSIKRQKEYEKQEKAKEEARLKLEKAQKEYDEINQEK